MKITLTREYVINNINKKFKDELEEPGEQIKVIKPEEDYQGKWPPKEFIDIVKRRYNKPIAILGYKDGHDMLYFFYNYELSDCFTDSRCGGLSGEDIFSTIFNPGNFNDEDGDPNIIGQKEEGHIHINDFLDDENYSINDYYAYVGNWDQTYVFQLNEDGNMYLPNFEKLEFDINRNYLIDNSITRNWRLKDLNGEDIIL